MVRGGAAVALAIATLAAGCSSNYIPYSRGRVSTVMVSGKMAYVRDGRMIQHGFLGSGLENAVRGNPEAERAARTYYQRQRDGLLVSLGGLVCSLVAIGYTAHEAADEASDDDDIAVPLVTAVGCLIASYGGLIYMASSAPYQLDAINLFNDRPPPCAPGPPGMMGVGPEGREQQLPSVAVHLPGTDPCATTKNARDEARASSGSSGRETTVLR
jgi:hypothetical protein